MNNTYILLGAIIVFGGLIGLLAYLYRESALLQGKSEIGIGPIRFRLQGRAQKKLHQTTPPTPPGVRENVVVNESRIDTVEGVEVSNNIVADESSITVRERKNR